ncbi:MAG TPA: nucleotidyltransferase [Oscillatoriaceae cyanobacterium]
MTSPKEEAKMYLLEAPRENSCDERGKFAIFGEACRILEDARIPHVMGGGVAIRAYGRSRPLKDADLFMQKTYVFSAMDELTRRGAFHTRDTDATWLYKAIKSDVLVDIIVRTTGNIHMTPETYERARMVELYGHPFRMMGPEDLLIRKIHSHREGRPDLSDAVSMLEAPIPKFDWRYFQRLAITNDYHRVLGFLLWVQAEFGATDVPPWLIRNLTERVLADYGGASSKNPAPGAALRAVSLWNPQRATALDADGHL